MNNTISFGITVGPGYTPSKDDGSMPWKTTLLAPIKQSGVTQSKYKPKQKVKSSKRFNTTSKYLRDEMVIHYVDGICGSGKTYGIMKHLGSLGKYTGKWLIAAPSIKLSKEIYSGLLEMGVVGVERIDSESKPDPEKGVAKNILDRMRLIDIKKNGVIVITHSGLDYLSNISKKSTWNLVIDEIPPGDTSYSIEKKEKRFFSVIPSKYNDILEVKYKGEFLDRDSDLYSLVNSLHFGKGYVEKENWEKREKPTFLVFLAPKKYLGYKKTIIMGANFKNSMLYKVWSSFFEIKFSICQEIQNNLRQTKHQNPKRLTLFYLQEQSWSKWGRDSGNTLEKYVSIVNRHFNGKEFLYVVNNDIDDIGINGERIPVKAHGLNEYSHIHNICFSPALNRTPQSISTLNKMGITWDFLVKAFSHEVAYQSIMRTSLRNPNSNEKVEAMVIDKATAHFIASLFPGADIYRIEEK